MPYRNRLIFGLIKMILSTVFHAIYAVVSLFKLQYALLVIVTWVILLLAGITEKYPIANVLLSMALVASVVYAVFAILKGLLGFGGKKKKRRGAQVVKSKKATDEQADEPEKIVAESGAVNSNAPIESERVNSNSSIQTPPIAINDQPKYYRVKQNPELIMAEFLDRYELYKISGDSLVKIRTDFKN